MTDTTNTQKTNRLIVAAILIGMAAFAYSSFDARLHLRPEMPKDFVDNSKSIPASDRSREEKLARAYWKCAQSIQWKYGYGGRLPDDPPPEFLVTAQDVGTAASDTSSRRRYWRRFQEVWYVPNNWEKSYDLDFPQVTRSLQAGAARLELWLRRLIGAPW
jgi:hypothetical protein